MTGDGTNDAPALAQADVGVSMNTGTSAAKEAGNMVDLDSDPTKLIEIVEIGKQLLITRGALTTFSIANDIAKYFAIIPAIFAAVYPSLDALNIMRLHSPASAITSAIIFNALIIVALIPLALRGVRYRPSSASKLLSRNLLDLRPGRRHRAVHRHQAHRPGRPVHPGDVEMRLPSWIAQHLAALRALLVFTVLLGLAYPLALVAVARLPGLADKAQGSLVQRCGRQPGRQQDHRPVVHRRRRQPAPAVLPEPPVGRRGRVRPDVHIGEQPRSGEHRGHLAGSRCGGRGRRPGRGQPEPAHPGLRAQPRRRPAGGRRRSPALLHHRRCRRGAAGLPQRGPDRHGHPSGVGEPGLPGTPFITTYEGVPWSAPSRVRTTAAGC